MSAPPSDLEFLKSFVQKPDDLLEKLYDNVPIVAQDQIQVFKYTVRGLNHNFPYLGVKARSSDEVFLTGVAIRERNMPGSIVVRYEKIFSASNTINGKEGWYKVAGDELQYLKDRLWQGWERRGIVRNEDFDENSQGEEKQQDEGESVDSERVGVEAWPQDTVEQAYEEENERDSALKELNEEDLGYKKVEEDLLEQVDDKVERRRKNSKK